MIHSLRFRLLVAFTLVILVAVGAVYFFVNQTTRGEIRRYGERSEQARLGRVEIRAVPLLLQQQGLGGNSTLCGAVGEPLRTADYTD